MQSVNVWENLEKFVKKSPNSIAELARLARRDFKAVHSDVEILKDLELIKVSGSSKGKASSLTSNTTEIVLRIAV